MVVKVGSLGEKTKAEVRASATRLLELTGWLGHLYGVTLPVPDFAESSSLKQFCSGLLEPGHQEHPWWHHIRHLPLRERLTISGSLFLFRKVLPGKPPNILEWKKKMGISKPPLPDGYARHIHRTVDELFPVGWDKGWKRKVYNTTLRTTACLESCRGSGGCRGLIQEEKINRTEFCESLLSKYKRKNLSVSKVRVSNVITAGKVRTVTINSMDMAYLGPLHDLMYDHISQFPWLLRGEATPTSFKDFVRSEGEVFVSGDYESATDNLSPEGAKLILEAILRKCSRVPHFLREAAVDTLSCQTTDGFHVPGQLMGNALCFPLLCLQNYIAFKWSVARDVPVRINGDDIVFRATVKEYERWAEGVSASGLVLSRGKTMVDHRFFSLNSAFFTSGSVHVKEAPVIRSTCFFTPLEDVLSLGGRLNTLRRFSVPRRNFLQAELLRKFSSRIYHSQSSLRRGLGCRVSAAVLKKADLYLREVFYSRLDSRFDPVRRKANIGYFSESIPDGWTCVRSTAPVNQEVQRQFVRELVAAAWQPTMIGPEVPVRIISGRIAYVSPIRSRRVQRLMRLSRYAVRDLDPQLLPREKKGMKARWVRDSECPTFVKANG